jgi:hypothetical protein
LTLTTNSNNEGGDTRTRDQKVLAAIHFILAHFQQPQETLFPRTIMTAATPGQVVVNSVEEIFARFKAANYKDCRINAFPKYTSYGNINRQPANFIFIDFDLSSFGYDFRRIDTAVRNTLKKIAEVFGPEITPTILWTGGGYHLYLPLSGNIVPEQHQVFAEFADWWKTHEFKDLTSVFMGFAEDFLTDGKSDKGHTPTIKSCLLRVPFTINAKYDDEFSEVKIIQSAYNEDGSNKADVSVAAVQYILKNFRHFLFDHQTQYRLDQLRQSVKKYNDNGGPGGNSGQYQQQIQQQQQQVQQQQQEVQQQQQVIIDDINSMIRMKQRARKMGMALNKKRFQEYREKRRQQQQQLQQRRFSSSGNSSDVSVWVEQLLSVGIPDFRKRAVSLILAPYLVHKRKLTDEQAHTIMMDWLTTRCSTVRELSFKPERKVREALQQTRQSGGIMHMSYKTLQKQSPETCQILEQKSDKDDKA